VRSLPGGPVGCLWLRTAVNVGIVAAGSSVCLHQ